MIPTIIGLQWQIFPLLNLTGILLLICGISVSRMNPTAPPGGRTGEELFWIGLLLSVGSAVAILVQSLH